MKEADVPTEYSRHQLRILPIGKESPWPLKRNSLMMKHHDFSSILRKQAFDPE